MKLPRFHPPVTAPDAEASDPWAAEPWQDPWAEAPWLEADWGDEGWYQETWESDEQQLYRRYGGPRKHPSSTGWDDAAWDAASSSRGWLTCCVGSTLRPLAT